MTRDYSEAVAMYEAGWSVEQIAEHVGVSRQSMWKSLQRRRVQMRSHLRYGEANHFHRGGPTADDWAQNQLEQAIVRGEVQRLTTCEKCGASGTQRDGRSKIHAHHSDYTKPLDVLWLCQRCHHEWHKQHRAIMREEVVPSVVSPVTSSQRAILDPVSPSPMPADEGESRTPAICGLLSSQPFAYFDPATSSWRTSQATLASGSDEFSATWPKAGTTRDGYAYELRMSERPTAGSGSSSLPTPRATRGGSATETADLLPTPRMEGFDAGNHRGQPDSLNQTVRMLPTPRTSDANGAGQHGEGGDDLRTVLLPTPSVSDGTGGHHSRGGARSNELLLPGLVRSLGEPTNPPSSDGSES